MAWSPQTRRLWGWGACGGQSGVDLRRPPSHRNSTGLGASIPKPVPVPGEDAATWDALPAGPHTARRSLGRCRLWGPCSLHPVPEPHPPAETAFSLPFGLEPLGLVLLHQPINDCTPAPCTLCSRMSWWSTSSAGSCLPGGPCSQGGLWTPVVCARLRGEQCRLDSEVDLGSGDRPELGRASGGPWGRGVGL